MIRFNTRLTAETATTTQISRRDARDHPGRTIPALASTTAAISSTRAACTTAATRKPGGYTPGEEPPIAYEPQGAPKANASWNAATTAETTV